MEELFENLTDGNITEVKTVLASVIMALALYQLDGPDGRHWRSWNEALKRALVPTQSRRADGCADGSWDPAVDRWGFAGGRVYATAINVLTLEVFYRYERVFGAQRSHKSK